ncbi:MAG: hypothetical protein ABIC40_02855 [bacterium]
MKKGIVILPVICLLAIFTMSLFGVGCKGMKPKPSGKVPIDTSQFQPADEFLYLVDFNKAADHLAARMEKFVPEEEKGNRDVRAEIQSTMDEMGLSMVVAEELKAEANNTTIRAYGRYKLPIKDYPDLSYFMDLGTANVVLPTHFKNDQYLGHFFIANPDKIILSALKSIDEEFGSPSPGTPMAFSLDQFFNIMGFESYNDAFKWMGSEFIAFHLANPDFDPNKTPKEGETLVTPIFSLVALAVNDERAALDTLETFVQFMQGMGMAGEEDLYERKDLSGHDSIVITIPKELLLSMVPEEEKDKIGEIPQPVISAVTGYILFGDKDSVAAAVKAFGKSSGTPRIATIESELNFDNALYHFVPTNPGTWFSIIEKSSPEVQDLFKKIYDQTRDLGSLGISRMSIKIEDSERAALEIETSRESLKLFDIIWKIAEETDPEVWQELGKQFGQGFNPDSMGMSPGMPVSPMPPGMGGMGN